MEKSKKTTSKNGFNLGEETLKMKIYELTTNAKDGYAKFYVRGIKNDSEAKRLALKGFTKKYAWVSGGGINYYDDEPSKYHPKKFWLRHSMTKSQFLKHTKRYR